ncbi:glucose-6-phosphatase 3-like [Mya arenaria]|uniref:glucose-6-phosphatase 3-like n=1 Tax=Mya arenaria TaxID=6604 RepID=UPI0022E4EB1D|nr:glucose-6-phosphatase 3-like [Mya arenaria]XP_052805681.1 glucose-6-phosphatase 3-like [Mya arenaria]
MDFIHKHGIEVIQFLQNEFPEHSGLMQTMSRMGDPRAAFLIYFPVAYCLHKRTGIQVLWLACLSEWMNNLLKWVMHGERPYWWVRECGHYPSNSTIVQQFPLTCETGPGSPSGHGMVTASVVYYIVLAVIRIHKPRLWVQAIIWSVFVWFLIAVNVSRLYIATHFPHQVIFGTFIGIAITVFTEQFKLPDARYNIPIATSVIIPLSCILTFYVFKMIGLDPQWSITLATKHCADPSWIHLDTTLFNAVYRDAGGILGLGLFHYVISEMSIPRFHASENMTSLPYFNRLIHVGLTLFLCQMAENVKPGQYSAIFYYFFTCLKFAVLTFTTMSVTNVFSTGKIPPGSETIIAEERDDDCDKPN